jgi:hypothetical protein
MFLKGPLSLRGFTTRGAGPQRDGFHLILISFF